MRAPEWVGKSARFVRYVVVRLVCDVVILLLLSRTGFTG